MQEAVAKCTGPIAKLPAGKLSKRRNVDATPKWKLRWSEALDRKAWATMAKIDDLREKAEAFGFSIEKGPTKFAATNS